MSKETHIGILVCQPQKVLDHKLRDGKEKDGNYCYWSLSRFPSRINEYARHHADPYSEPARAPGGPQYADDDWGFEVEVRLYFAVKGFVVGYFKCGASDQACEELRFHSEDFVAIRADKQPTIKPSQGWRYFSHEPENELKG